MLGSNDEEKALSGADSRKLEHLFQDLRGGFQRLESAFDEIVAGVRDLNRMSPPAREMAGRLLEPFSDARDALSEISRAIQSGGR